MQSTMIILTQRHNTNLIKVFPRKVPNTRIHNTRIITTTRETSRMHRLTMAAQLIGKRPGSITLIHSSIIRLSTAMMESLTKVQHRIAIIEPLQPQAICSHKTSIATKTVQQKQATFFQTWAAHYCTRRKQISKITCKPTLNRPCSKTRCMAVSYKVGIH